VGGRGKDRDLIESRMQQGVNIVRAYPTNGVGIFPERLESYQVKVKQYFYNVKNKNESEPESKKNDQRMRSKRKKGIHRGHRDNGPRSLGFMTATKVDASAAHMSASGSLLRA
jgi:hypothetical protein